MIPISIRFSRSNGGLEEGAADFLVNTKLGMNGLTELLARLENLSHILAWSDRVAWTFHGYAFVKGLFPAWYFQEKPGKRMATSLGDQSLGHALELFCSSPPTAFLVMEPYSQCEPYSWSLAISFLLLKPQFLVMGISPNVCTPSTIPIAVRIVRDVLSLGILDRFLWFSHVSQVHPLHISIVSVGVPCFVPTLMPLYIPNYEF